MLATGESVADRGVETHAERAEKRLTVDRTVIARHRAVAAYDFERRAYVHRYVEMTGQTITRSAGNDSQLHPRAAKRRSGLVDRTVAAGGYDGVKTLLGGAARQTGGVAVGCGPGRFYCQTVIGQTRGHKSVQAALVARAGDRVDYEQTSFLVHTACKVRHLSPNITKFAA